MKAVTKEKPAKMFFEDPETGLYKCTQEDGTVKLYSKRQVENLEKLLSRSFEVVIVRWVDPQLN